MVEIFYAVRVYLEYLNLVCQGGRPNEDSQLKSEYRNAAERSVSCGFRQWLYIGDIL